MNLIKSIDSSIKKTMPKTQRSRASRFILLEKTQPTDVSTLSKGLEHIPEGASTYTYISIGKKSDPDFKREIVAFNDKNGELIRKIIAGSGLNTKIRNYSKNTYAKDGWNEFLEHRHIKTKKLCKNNVWKTQQEEDQYIHLTTDKYKYGKGFAKKLHIDKNEYIEEKGNEKIRATITEYPFTLGFENKCQKKVMGVEMTVKNNRPHIEKITNDTNIELPQDDEFLAYRFLLGKQKQTCLTQHILDQKGVGNLGVGIYYSKTVVPENSEGLFNHLDGNIYYKDVSKSHPAKIAAHEGEHVYQYSLIGRLGKLLSKFGIVCKTNLPGVTDLKEMDKGYKYVVASENYPVLTATENLKENKAYWNNELEAGAREASQKFAQLYEHGRQVLSKIFPYSKSETNF